MKKTRTKEEAYIVCDFCEKEITDDDTHDSLHWISGDFPDVVVHKEPCMRQAIVIGIQAKK